MVEKRPDRRTFVRGVAGAAALGATGALSSKLEFAAASEPFRPDTVEIDVFLASAGRKKALVVADAEAKVDDTVVWVPRRGVDCIRQVRFKGGKTPFAQINNPGACTPSQKNLTRPVRSNAPVDTYTYLIAVKGDDGNTYTLDPDLDIT